MRKVTVNMHDQYMFLSIFCGIVRVACAVRAKVLKVNILITNFKFVYETKVQKYYPFSISIIKGLKHVGYKLRGQGHSPSLELGTIGRMADLAEKNLVIWS